MVKLYRCRRLVNSYIYIFPVFRHEVIVTNETDWSKLYCNLMSFTISTLTLSMLTIPPSVMSNLCKSATLNVVLK